MKLSFPILALVILMTSSACLNRSDDNGPIINENQAQIDRDIILAEIPNRGGSFEAHPSGLFYKISSNGGEARPNLDSEIEIRYRGELLDGTVFDETPNNSTRSFPLRGLIQGWQIGIPLIGRAGAIELLIPSALAYGPAGSPPSIPGNTVIYFRIDLVDFFN